MSFVERIQECPLHLEPRGHGPILLDAGFDGLAHLGDRFDAEALGELIVEDRRLGRRHLLHLDLELHGLPRELGFGIALGKSRVDHAFLSCRDAGQPVLEAGNEAAAAKHDRCTLGGPALEGLAIELADEVDGHPIAFLGGAVLRLVVLVGGEDPLDRLVDVLIGHGCDEPRELDLGEVHHLDLGQHLKGKRVSEIAGAGENLVDFRLVLWQRDLRLEGRALLPLGQGLAARLGDRLLNDLGHHRAAIDFAQMLLRHVTRPEALDARLALQLIEARGQPPLQLVGTDHDLQLPAQPIRIRFNDVHTVSIHYCSAPEGVCRKRTIQRVDANEVGSQRVGWCGRRELNPHGRSHQNLNLACLPVSPRPL